jgi:hypothetical protein
VTAGLPDLPSIMLLLTLLTVVATASAATTSLYQYDLSDSAANSNYDEGSIEYHCFDIDGGATTYVRGTYGNFGYFEGAVDDIDPFVFHVNWYETAAGTLTPTMGAATLTYATDYVSVTGPYWSSGTSDISGSYGPWNSQNGVFNTDDSTSAGQETILQKCLYPGATVAAARSEVAALSDTSAVSGSSEQGENTLCAMPAGPAGGSWLGTYTYQYTEAEGGSTEKGNYGINPFSFWGESGMGFLGTWHASTGDYAGDKGPNLYMVVGAGADTSIVGFYCSVDDDGIRTDCYNEFYTVDAAAENADNCPAYYRLDGSLDSLYDFASTGSDASDGGSNSDMVPIAMAILFSCLFGMLAGVVMYMCATKSAAQGPIAVATEEKRVDEVVER